MQARFLCKLHRLKDVNYGLLQKLILRETMHRNNKGVAMSSYRKAQGFFILLALLCWVVGRAQEPQQPQQQPKIDWQAGPTVGYLGDIAQINIPKGYRFTGKKGAQQVLVLTHNVPGGNELGALVSDAENSNWFMIFEFHDTGYVKDDEK